MSRSKRRGLDWHRNSSTQVRENQSEIALSIINKQRSSHIWIDIYSQLIENRLSAGVLVHTSRLDQIWWIATVEWLLLYYFLNFWQDLLTHWWMAGLLWKEEIKDAIIRLENECIICPTFWAMGRKVIQINLRKTQIARAQTKVPMLQKQISLPPNIENSPCLPYNLWQDTFCTEQKGWTTKVVTLKLWTGKQPFPVNREKEMLSRNQLFPFSFLFKSRSARKKEVNFWSICGHWCKMMAKISVDNNNILWWFYARGHTYSELGHICQTQGIENTNFISSLKYLYHHLPQNCTK